MFLRLFLALVLLSCSNSSSREPAAGSGSAAVPAPAPANPASMTDDQIVDAALKSMETIASLAKQYASDCEALAKALADHAAKNADLIKRFKTLASDLTKQREIATRYGDRITQIGQDTIASLQAHCAGHPAVKKLFETLN